MQIVYAHEAIPDQLNKSVFLVGPTPRKSNPVPSWRPKMIEVLADSGFDGHVFVPEPRDDKWTGDYLDQTRWEKQFLEIADRIIAWVPRDLDTMPAFTTNVEFGRYVNDGKLFYGRPSKAPKTQYLDWMYEDCTGRTPCETMEELAAQAINIEGVDRTGGERFVPLDVYHTPMFQEWLSEQREAGNRLEEAEVLWKFMIPEKGILFSYTLWVKVWIEAEQRFKENEYIFARSNISTILPYWLDLDSNMLLDTKIVMVKEFRSPAGGSGFVHELPGGSTFDPKVGVLQVAASELKEETGLEIEPERFHQVKSRQMASTLCTHKATLFAVELTDEEVKKAEEIEASQKSFGVEEDTERTYVEVKTLNEILLTTDVDWSMIGMIFNGIADHLNHRGSNEADFSS